MWLGIWFYYKLLGLNIGIKVKLGELRLSISKVLS